MHHRLLCGFLLAGVGLSLVMRLALSATDATETASQRTPATPVAAKIVDGDDAPPAVPCDVDPGFSIEVPGASVDPGFVVPASPDNGWADVDPAFSVRIACDADAIRRRVPAATPAP